MDNVAGMIVSLHQKLRTIFSDLLNVLLVALIPFVFTTDQTQAQDIDGVSSFVVAGVSMNIPKSNKLLLYTGVSPTDNIRALLVLPNFKVLKYVTLTPGYTYVNVDTDQGGRIEEHQFLGMATLTIPLAKNWTITDRNMYFYRFRSEMNDLSFYRNRLGIIHKTQLFKKSGSLFLHNEVYMNLNSGAFTRNRVVLGADLKLFKWLTPQIMGMYQSDKATGNRILAWLVFTIPLENFGAFKSTTL